MFSANENIVLRQHKRRICQYVEECLPEDVLDRGATVMVMQVSCKAPGCVPLETVVMIVFPFSDTELISGVKESANGGTYKTKVLLPMAAVAKQDILEALPPAFPGGLRTMERLCHQARDVMLGQISQLMGDDDVEGRKLMAQYLHQSLADYMKRDCITPEYGEPFAPLPLNDLSKESTTIKGDDTISLKPVTSNGGNFVIRRQADDDDTANFTPTTSTVSDAVAPSSKISGTKSNTTIDTTATAATRAPSKSSSMDWRRQQTVEKVFESTSIIERLSQREHAPGVRVAGCPCCDPDNPSNYVDSIMML